MMTTRDATVIALKISAVYVLVQVALAAWQLSYFLDTALHASRALGASHYVVIATAFTPYFALAALGVWVWRLSNRMPRDGASRALNQPEPELDTVLLSLFGLALLILALLDFFYFASMVVQHIAYDPERGRTVASFAIEFVGYLLKAIIGVSLIIGTSGWARWLRRLRHAGVGPTAAEREAAGNE